MSRREGIKKVFFYGVVTCYVIFLIKLFFLSRVSIFELFDSGRMATRSVNLIPFNTIIEYISGKTTNLKDFAFINLVGNIFVFIPLGVYLPLIKKDKSLKSNFLFIFIACLFVEIIQWVLCIGAADIDDIILNCLGGFIGILGYKLLRLFISDEKKVRTIITVLSSIVGLPVLLYLLFFISLRL
ncbi:VanZ family protein [Clostridium sp. AL.422]|uniref:VanZ family protein n=1 Tax=Clostridium TaxID=1485 RepID=UPI00293DB72A|nr:MULTISPECIES: VanZ family protein [unclassified Clostridium]MDV4150770.1 VanZ family protein [Clostridium sp. AL.422]